MPSSVSAGLAAQYAIQQQWLTQDNGQLEIILTMLGQGDNTMGIQVALQHPWSRGTVFINSTNAFEPPLIDPYYFNVGYDMDIMNYGSAFARKLAATAPLNEYMIAETLPGAGVTGDALTNYTKRDCGTEYHPLGTCSMLPQASGGVVDTNLIVYGSANLRVIDASVIPIHMSAHLMATSYGIAEKGSDIIKAKYMAVVHDPATASSSTPLEGSGETGVVNANAASGNNGDSTQLSTGAKAGIGAGIAVAVVAIGAALVSLVCLVGGRSRWWDADILLVIPTEKEQAERTYCYGCGSYQ
jgi:choline dehydrogenase